MYDARNVSKFGRIGDHAPEAFRGYVELDRAAFADGALSLKHKELMAVAVALTTQCPYCIEIHANNARQAGASDSEIAESVLVAAVLRAGGAITHGTHAMKGI